MTTNKRINGLSNSAAISIGAAAICGTTVTLAQETQSASSVIQEVIVTATKRTERLQDVPLSVSAVSGADIEARGFSQYADYLNTLPGVYFQNTAPGSSDIRIRGIVATGGSGSEVATYFGETVTSVITNQGGKPNLRLVDIERVEVLRGPQGTLFGANALTGVVRIVPAAPDLGEFQVDFGTSGSVTVHSDDPSYQVEGMVNISLIQDRLALRLGSGPCTVRAAGSDERGLS